ncbi:hypothetical protein EHS39_15995 [Ensifer sp. MPMI2T]|nr:hypothetical protein EHS39_15995 [Ensifer sp. MPMI2T]
MILAPFEAFAKLQGAVLGAPRRRVLCQDPSGRESCSDLRDMRAYSAARLMRTRKGRCSTLNCCMFLSLNRLRSKETCSSNGRFESATDGWREASS